MAKPRSKPKHKELIRFTEYMVSGGAYFWVGYGAFFVFDHLWHWHLWWATIVSNFIGWTVNFVLQRYWVFSSKQLKGHQTQVTGRYAVITLTDFLLNYFILWGLKAVGVTPYIGQFLSAGFFTGWNYLWYKYWVFPEQFKKLPKKQRTVRVVAHRAHGHRAYHKASRA